MRRSCCRLAIGTSVPSSESSTRRRFCHSPKTIWEVRETVPFSFSLCCTKSDRRIAKSLHADSQALLEASSISVCSYTFSLQCKLGLDLVAQELCSGDAGR